MGGEVGGGGGGEVGGQVGRGKGVSTNNKRIC